MPLWECDHELALCIWTMMENVSFKPQFAFATIYWTWFVITLICTLMNELYLWTLCNMWHACWIMYDLGCMLMVNRDPSWYSTDYLVYMVSSMTVRPLAGCHCTCTLINWSVLRQTSHLITWFHQATSSPSLSKVVDWSSISNFT